MKIKIINKTYSEVARIPTPRRKKPLRPSIFFRALVRLVSIPALAATRAVCDRGDIDRVKGRPSLILMNHSSFIDPQIASKLLFPSPYAVVSTHDGFVGLGWIMRLIGCIPTRKFVSDMELISDMRYAVEELGISVLMYPEAGYSLDGRTTTLPRGLGYLAKKLNVPVIMIETDGAFQYQPLYNCLKKRKVQVKAKARVLFTPEEAKEMRVAELDRIIDEAFSFDSLRSQQEQGIRVTEPDRCEGLERVLYKCASCGSETAMASSGARLYCKDCGAAWTLSETGALVPEGDAKGFTHVPDWFEYQRSEVLREITDGSYSFDEAVEIYALKDYRGLYHIGEGRLTHGREGFALNGCDGELSYTQSALASYSVNVDLFWYEIGDMIGIGAGDIMFYCVPKRQVPVAKVRLAAEELYKLCRAEKRRG